MTDTQISENLLETEAIIDESDEWTDEDLRDVSLASFAYFEQTENLDEENQ